MYIILQCWFKLNIFIYLWFLNSVCLSYVGLGVINSCSMFLVFGPGGKNFLIPAFNYLSLLSSGWC